MLAVLLSLKIAEVGDFSWWWIVGGFLLEVARVAYYKEK